MISKHKGHIDIDKDDDGYLYSLFVNDLHYGDIQHLSREEFLLLAQVYIGIISERGQQ